MQKKKIINIYILISLLFFIFGIELVLYFYCAVNNFLNKIPLEVVNKNEFYFSCGIIILIFICGLISGIVAVKHNIVRKIAIIVISLNLIGILSIASVLGLKIYNNYKDNKQVNTEYQEKNITQSNDSDKNKSVKVEAESGDSAPVITEEAKQTQIEATKAPVTEAAQKTEEMQEQIQEQEDPQNDNVTQQKESKTQQSSIISRYSFECGDNIGTWEDAYRACKQNNAHLVTFETQEEFNEVAEKLNSMGYQDYIFYIGGRRDMDSQKYYWIDENNNLTGSVLNNAESWTSECWLEGEPSFRDESLGVDEHVMCMFYKKDIGKWVWNDIPNDLVSVVPTYAGKIGIIYEYEN